MEGAGHRLQVGGHERAQALCLASERLRVATRLRGRSRIGLCLQLDDDGCRVLEIHTEQVKPIATGGVEPPLMGEDPPGGRKGPWQTQAVADSVPKKSRLELALA